MNRNIHPTNVTILNRSQQQPTPNRKGKAPSIHSDGNTQTYDPTDSGTVEKANSPAVTYSIKTKASKSKSVKELLVKNEREVYKPKESILVQLGVLKPTVAPE
jgi:hypothetical protein